jgi:hypothetical protein
MSTKEYREAWELLTGCHFLRVVLRGEVDKISSKSSKNLGSSTLVPLYERGRLKNDFEGGTKSLRGFALLIYHCEESFG